MLFAMYIAACGIVALGLMSLGCPEFLAVLFGVAAALALHALVNWQGGGV